jgi:nitrate/TMAO reductase-like tetraheme cytochrome c subunit
MTLTLLRLLALGALVVLIAVIGSVTYVSYREQDNTFCVSCHTQPETEYLARYLCAAQTQDAQDLASFHHRKKEVRCIDCHGGEGALGHAEVEAFAARNAFKYLSGTAQQPAVIILPLQNEACIKCHEQQVRKPGFENHMHNKYFDPKESPPFIRCTDCHVSHRPGDERTAFQFRDAILPKCEYCHATIGRGPRGLSK